jgi:hypothetical protein
MNNTKYFKFHFKSEKQNKAKSYNIKLEDFNSAMAFAYDKLDELNDKNNGYRIVGIYEILTPLADYYASEATN